MISRSALGYDSGSRPPAPHPLAVARQREGGIARTQDSQQNGSRRGRRFSRHRTIGTDLDALEQPSGYRRGNRQHSVGRANPSLSQSDGAIVNTLNSQALEAFDATDDVDHRIDGADFMQRHIICRHAVDPAFLFRQQSERPDGALAHPIGQGGPLEDRDQVPHMVMRGVGVVRVLVSAGGVVSGAPAMPGWDVPPRRAGT